MIEFSSEMDVELVQSIGSDITHAGAAWVSVNAEKALERVRSGEGSLGVIESLMASGHGSPFEHNLMTFVISAPIMVWREFHRHRVGFSYNEQSGRYSKMKPRFYVPPRERPCKPVPNFKPMRPEFEALSESEYSEMVLILKSTHESAWDSYEALLALGTAKEVARSVLGVGIYSTCWVTCNCRSLMHFLKVRVKSEKSRKMSYPQYEIDSVASKMEAIWQGLFPLTAKWFVEYGRDGV